MGPLAASTVCACAHTFPVAEAWWAELMLYQKYRMPDKVSSDWSCQSHSVVIGHPLPLSGPGGGSPEPQRPYLDLQFEFPLISASSENASPAVHAQALFPWQ